MSQNEPLFVVSSQEWVIGCKGCDHSVPFANFGVEVGVGGMGGWKNSILSFVQNAKGTPINLVRGQGFGGGYRVR